MIGATQLEARAARGEAAFETSAWAVPVFGNNDLSDWVFLFLSVEEDDQIGILFQGAGLTEIAEPGLPACLFEVPVELTQNDSWNLHFFGDAFHGRADDAYLPLTDHVLVSAL